MSQEMQTKLNEQSKKLIDGPLKHIRGAALAAALLPLASVAAAPANAQSICGSAGLVCGTVFNDANNNGIMDVGETPIADAQVTITDSLGGTMTQPTGTDGTFSFFVGTTPGVTSIYTVAVLIPTGTQPSPLGTPGSGFPTSAGVPTGTGYVTATSDASGGGTDFGFHTSAVAQPGTGTLGYWKNHPSAWPVASITIGGVSYTRDQAIAWMNKIGKDRTTIMFAQLVAAKLNVLIGNDGSCVNPTITAADSWMATYGPVGSGVSGSSAAWAVGDPLQQTLDAYNNGLLCAPHRK